MLSSFHYHYARLIEILYALEKIEQLLRAPEILDPNVRALASANQSEGVGVAEAPRGTLMHHYKVDANGLITWANLIIATGPQQRRHEPRRAAGGAPFRARQQAQEGMLNRVEAVIRAFDPCLSCSTHADGRLALEIDLRDAAGEVVDTLTQ